ncbi:MAG: plastocyanin/azurin family copper-binding protein [Dehalococcoidia bacterium]
MHRISSLFALLAFAAGALAISTPATALAQPGSGAGGHTAHGALASAQQPAAVRIADFSFSPKDITVRTGTTVTWTNEGRAPHTVTADKGAFDSKRMNGGATFSFTFDTPGTYEYHCDIHPSMTGEVTVEGAPAASTPAPTVTPRATPTSAPVAAPAASAASTARIVDFAFEPDTITVPAGTKVTWTHAGQAPHTVTADNKRFDSGRLTAGQSFDFTFDTPGTYAYKCEIHPGRMTGSVVVQAASGGEARPAFGVISFGDGQARSDQIRVAVENLAPQPGATIVGWLTNADGAYVRLGELNPDASGKAALTYTDPTSRNLIATYDRAVVTAESTRDGARPAGRELLRDEIPTGAMLHIRHLLARFDTTPNNIALATGLLTQAEVAAGSAAKAKQSLDANDLAGMRAQLEQVINLIEGQQGANGDLNGDERRDNPGDGLGLLNYAATTAEHAQLAIDGAPGDKIVRLHGGHVIASTKNTAEWLAEARALVLSVFRAPNATAARPSVDRLNELLAAVLNGRDANRDGRIEPIPGEGGARTAYDHAQLMATLEATTDQVQAASAPAASTTPASAPAAAAAPATGEPDAVAPQIEESDGGNGTRVVIIAFVALGVLLILVGGGAWFFTGRTKSGI